MKKTEKVMLAAAAAGAAAWGGMYAVTRQLVRYAVARDAPPAFRRLEQAVTGSLLPPALGQTLQTAAKTLSQRPHQVVEIEGFDGTRLVGHWFAADHPRRAVLAMHGWRSSWCRDFGLAADFLHDSGCSVLYVEQRGQNASGGACMGLGMTERYDCCRWADWLAGQCGALPLYLCGISMGASTVLMASGLPLPGAGAVHPRRGRPVRSRGNDPAQLCGLPGGKTAFHCAGGRPRGQLLPGQGRV